MQKKRHSLVFCNVFFKEQSNAILHRFPPYGRMRRKHFVTVQAGAALPEHTIRVAV